MLFIFKRKKDETKERKKLIDRAIKKAEKIWGVEKDFEAAKKKWLTELYKNYKLAEIYAEKAAKAKEEGNMSMYNYYKQQLTEVLGRAKLAEEALKRLRVQDQTIRQIMHVTGITAYFDMIEKVLGAPLNEFVDAVLTQYAEYLAKLEQVQAKLEAIKGLEADMMKKIEEEAETFISSKLLAPEKTAAELEEEAEKLIEEYSKKLKEKKEEEISS